MNTDTILDLLNDVSKIQAFRSCLEKLETAPRLDIEALKVCIKLRPALHTTAGADDFNKDIPSERVSKSSQDQEIIALHERLYDLLVARIPQEQLDSDHFYNLAEILCSDGTFANVLIRQKIYKHLLAVLPELSGTTEATDEPEGTTAQIVHTAKSFLTLLKCSYWLPSDRYHVVDPGSLGLLSQFLGIAATDDIAHDAISALLSLLRQGEPIIVAPPTDTPQSWLDFDSASGQTVLSTSIVDGSLWDRLSTLEYKNQTTGESNVPYTQYLPIR